MPMSDLKQVLVRARKHEAQSQQLAHRLQRLLTDLHPSIHLPESARLNTLLVFMDEYMSHVPRLVQALERAAVEARQERLVAPLLARIRASFRLKDDEGMVTLLDRAYYVQRLVEEINDRFLLMAGAPLLTLDMTTANLIIHSLIGEPYANQLDAEASSAAAHIMNLHVGPHPEHFYQENQGQRLKMWATAWRHWSEEYGLNGIAVSFEMDAPGEPDKQMLV